MFKEIHGQLLYDSMQRNPRPSSAEIKNAWGCTFTHP